MILSLPPVVESGAPLPLKQTTMQTIRAITTLRQVIEHGCSEFKLGFPGGLYSGKTITLLPNGRFRVENHIDGSVQRLTEKQLFTESNIGAALRIGALVACP